MNEETRAEETDPLLPKHPATSPRLRNADNTLQPSTSHNRPSSKDGSSSSRRPSSTNTDPLSAEDIYTLLGMAPPDPSGTTPKTLESAHGFYAHLLQKDRTISKHYRLYDLFIISLMVLQLCISAVFIVLGSLRNVDSHIAVACLGAISTVIAGVLALMKGQGLPNRLRMERDGLRRVIFETEELYWDARAGRDVSFEDVMRLREEYTAVMDDARKNHPDVWTASPVPIRSRGASGGKMRMGGSNEVAKT